MTPERLAVIKKICACIPFATPEAGLRETDAAMRELIEHAAAMERERDAAQAACRRLTAPVFISVEHTLERIRSLVKPPAMGGKVEVAQDLLADLAGEVQALSAQLVEARRCRECGTTLLDDEGYCLGCKNPKPFGVPPLAQVEARMWALISRVDAGVWERQGPEWTAEAKEVSQIHARIVARARPTSAANDARCTACSWELGKLYKMCDACAAAASAPG